ncbi:sigma factor-like helix-turn-helix DNA-binding protein [Faecalicatena contorta]|uniref:sigma factor-like helix-turn-helix DNA-binding protein n=1 Tax=Faecalicatena contorta TaxID=39482 RepID=UPI001FA8B167|nr:sigma factor-like helix-turn-helix DNA-binding protein [Faecalicatena contorta]
MNKEIRGKQAERILVQLEMEEVEKYIEGIQDGEVREIFELHFLQGMKQKSISEKIGYTQGRISQLIGNQLKD